MPGAPHRLIRVAGAGRLPDGSRVTWVVSEGRKGRRWREAITGPAGGGLRSSLLYESDPAGRFVHLELSTPDGLLTLHPERDGTLHGNVVTVDGVRHVVGYPFPPNANLVVAGSPIAAAAVAFSSTLAAGSPTDADTTRLARVTADAVVVGPSLALSTARVVVESGPDGTRRLVLDRPYRSDGDGLPMLADERRWALELDGASWTDRGQTAPHAPADVETRG